MHAISLSERYTPRDIRFLDLWDLGEWRVKVYGITHRDRSMPDTEMMQTVKAVARDRLSRIDAAHHYGVAFVIIHLARESDFVLIDSWTNENVLQQSLLTCPPNRPAALRDITSTGLLACVWELEVHNFERTAWMEDVLKQPAGSDLQVSVEGYLNRRFCGSV